MRNFEQKVGKPAHIPDLHACQQHSTVHTSRSSPTQFVEGVRIPVGNRREWIRSSPTFNVAASRRSCAGLRIEPFAGAAVAAEMKKVKPQVPIVMLTDHLELTEGTLKSVDALVTKSDGPHFLWATVRFILNVKPAQHLEGKLRNQTPAPLCRPGKSREGWNGARPTLARDEKALPFSLRVWQSIRNGPVQS